MTPETTPTDFFDYSIVCHAEVDLPAWLGELSGKAGWHFQGEDEAELCDIYYYRKGGEDAQVVLYHTGHATVEVNGALLYDAHLGTSSGFARLQYYNAESGEPVLLN